MKIRLFRWCLVVLSWIVFRGTAGEKHLAAPAFRGTFIENKGQWEGVVQFRAELPYGTLFLEKNALTYRFLDENVLRQMLRFKFLSPGERSQSKLPGPDVPAHVYRVTFDGSNPGVTLVPQDRLPDYKNYYTSVNPERWRSRVRHYAGTAYRDLYEGIDMEISGKDHSLKVTFYVGAGYDPGCIRMTYHGAEGLRLRNGNLQVRTSVNTLTEMAPVAWQTGTSGERIPVACTYRLKDNTLQFAFPDGYRTDLPLIIDPVLVFASYSGSPVDNWGYTATYDKDGFLYAGGSCFMPGYPTTIGACQVNFGGGSSDIVISKYDTTGSFMIYSTYLGGSGTEVPSSLVVNGNNELIVLGCTGSDDFPVTSQAYDQTFNGGTNYTLTYILHYPNGSDISVSRFSADGSDLLSSTYLGGSGNDGLNAFPPLKHNYADDLRGEIKVDDLQHVYLCTSTQSPDFPVTPGAFQTGFSGVQDACLVKFNPSMSSLSWASFLGGSSADAGYSLVLNDSGRVYLAGGTTSADFPVTGLTLGQAFHGGTCDGYISCFSQTGNNLLYSSYFGTTGYDQAYFVDKDKLDNIFLLGQTDGPSGTLVFNAAWNSPGAGQFISKLRADLSGLIYSTRFGTGGSGPDISPTAFMVDRCNYVYVSGWGGQLNAFGGTAGMPITADAFQSTTDDNDYYFLVMEGDASGLRYATFYGGTQAHEHVDGGTSRFDKKGRIYQSVCAGCGGYDDFPTTPGAWSTTNPGPNCNNAVIKYDFLVPLAVADFINPPSGCAPYSAFFQNTSFSSSSQATHYYWDFGNGNTSAAENPTQVFMQPGLYPVTLIISDSGTCNLADTITQTLVVLGSGAVQLAGLEICAGQSVQIGLSSPLPDPSVFYQWIPATGLSDHTLPNPLAGPPATTNYTLLISNGLCSDTAQQTLVVYDIEVDAGNDTTVCQNQIELTASGNYPALQFTWSASAAFADTLNPNPSDSVIQVTLTGQETWFYVRASNGLCQDIDSVRVSFSILLLPTGGMDPSCPDSCDGIASIDIDGGTPPFSFLWSTGNTADSVGQLCAGTYTVTVTDSLQCMSVATILLQEPEDIVPLASVSHIPCEEICTGSVNLTVSGGTPPYSYLWDNGMTTPDIGQLCAGTYSVSVRDAHRCPAGTQATVEVHSIFQNVQVSASPDTIYQGLSTQLDVTSFPGCSYLWSPSSGLSRADIPNPVAGPQLTTLYTVTLTDPYGCIWVDSVKVVVKEVICRDPYIHVPNAFTPNNDLKNDVFLIRGSVIESFELSVYDRWGNRVFHASDQGEAWDGTWKGSDCEQGVYVYHLKIGCYNKEKFISKGNITLIR